MLETEDLNNKLEGIIYVSEIVIKLIIFVIPI